MIDIDYKGNSTIHRGWNCSCGQPDRVALGTEQQLHAAWRKRAEEAEAELAAMALERDSYMLLSKMRPAPMADMVPAEELAKVDADRKTWKQQALKAEAERDAAVARLRYLYDDTMSKLIWHDKPPISFEQYTSNIDAARKEEGK